MPATSERQQTSCVWCGPVYEPTGYADEVRSMVGALERAGTRVALRASGIPREGFADSLPPDEEARLRRQAARRPGPGFVLVQHFPAGGLVQLPSVLNVARTMFETDGLPANWVQRCNEMDEVWVPSRFNRDSFRAAGVAAPIEIIPGGIDTERFHPDVEPLAIPGLRGTVFLSVFEWRDRKGWDVLLRAWANAFSPDDHVTLVLRSARPLQSGERPSPPTADRLATAAAPPLAERIDRFLRERCSAGLADVARIVVLDRPIPAASLPALYTAADVLVAPSRGEGWGRPLMEAMAAGRPVIATAWSAPLDFLDDRYAYLLRSNGLVAAEDSTNGVYAGQRWADPCVAHLTALLRQAHADAGDRVRRGAAAREAMVADWPWEAVAPRISARLRTLAGTPVFPVSAARERGRHATTPPPRPAPPGAPAMVHLLRAEQPSAEFDALLQALVGRAAALPLRLPERAGRRPARWSDAATWWARGQMDRPDDSRRDAVRLRATPGASGTALCVWRRGATVPDHGTSAWSGPRVVLALDALPDAASPAFAAFLRDASDVWVSQPACAERARALGVPPDRLWQRPLLDATSWPTIAPTGSATRPAAPFVCLLPVLTPDAVPAADGIVRTWQRAWGARGDRVLRVLVASDDEALRRWHDSLRAALLPGASSRQRCPGGAPAPVEVIDRDTEDPLLPTWLASADVLLEPGSSAAAPFLWSVAAARGMPIVAAARGTGWPLPDELLALVPVAPNGRIAWSALARTLERLAEPAGRAPLRDALRRAARAMPSAERAMVAMLERLATGPAAPSALPVAS